ncbi:MAG TPA: winged helix-turn-helix domain-containing protein [Bryobacteraceae bacterium]
MSRRNPNKVLRILAERRLLANSAAEYVVVSTARDASIVRFGPFEVNVQRRLLRKRGVRIKLQTQPFRVLAALLEQPGAVITRDDLRLRLWPADTFVDFEHGLNTAVTRLRQALGDSAGRPRYIETVAKHGYRFCAEVETRPNEGDKKIHSVPAPKRERRVGIWIAAVIAVAVTGTGIYFMLRNHSLTRVERPVPLTTFTGFEANPAISPDGTQVAFTWNGENQANFDIYTMPNHSGPPVRLTTDPAEDLSPAWSPDGRTIAFLRRLNSERGQLVLVPAAGGPEHTLAETWEQTWFQPRRPRALTWAPDGRWIAATHHEAGEPSDGIYLFSLTGEKRRLTAPPANFYGDRMPAFSPNSRFLAFCRLPGGFTAEIYLLALDADFRPRGEPRRLTNNKRWSAEPVWTPDGHHILYVFGEDSSQGREVRVIDVANPQARARRILLSDDVSEIALGHDLVYARQFEDTNIWRAELPMDGKPPVAGQLFISSTWIDQTPQYSPDGKKIAFASSRSGSREIWVSNSDSSNPVRLTFFGGPMVGTPTWSHDGQWIAFHARPEGPTDVFVMPAAGGPVKRLTKNDWEDHYPVYSHDGRAIFFSSRRSGKRQIWRMSSDGGDPVQIVTPGQAHNPVESPDGKTIYYHRPEDPGEIWSVPVQGGQAVRVAGPTQRYPVGFTVTSKGIYYGAPPHAGQERFIRFLSFATGRNTPVVVAKRPFHTGVSVSPDSRYILYDQYDEEGSDLMLVENFRLP